MSLASFGIIYFSLAAIFSGSPITLKEGMESQAQGVEQAQSWSDNQMFQSKSLRSPKIVQFIQSLHRGSLVQASTPSSGKIQPTATIETSVNTDTTKRTRRKDVDHPTNGAH